jgi:YebC/PmpR family DNA-binding regulatory protein
MAGHSHAANVAVRKGKADKARAKIFTKIAREITVAVKSGAPDPDANPRLRAAISAARAANMPNDRIKSAINQGTGANKGDDYKEMRYEGYGQNGVAIIVQCLSDNANRTASDIRSTFTKLGGNLGETGSVSYNFEKVGLIEYPAEKASAEAMLEAVIEAGADDCESNEAVHAIYCKPENLMEVREELAKKFGDAETARFSWKPQNTIAVSGEVAQKLLKLIEALEDYDDVQYVVTNGDFDAASLEQAAS